MWVREAREAREYGRCGSCGNTAGTGRTGSAGARVVRALRELRACGRSGKYGECGGTGGTGGMGVAGMRAGCAEIREVREVLGAGGTGAAGIWEERGVRGYVWRGKCGGAARASGRAVVRASGWSPVSIWERYCTGKTVVSKLVSYQRHRRRPCGGGEPFSFHTHPSSASMSPTLTQYGHQTTNYLGASPESLGAHAMLNPLQKSCDNKRV